MIAKVLNIQVRRSASARQQVATQLRELILSGKAKAGSKLPAADILAKNWNVPYKSVHAAMAMLTKEGLLERTPRLGTFVAKRTRNLTRVGIYLADDIWHIPTAAFRRALVGALSNQLRAREIMPDIWIDSRPEQTHDTLWPDMERAAQQRQIQAIFNVSGTASMGWISRLPVPSVAMTYPGRNSVCVDVDAAWRLAVADLVRQGCRSAGMIAPRPKISDPRFSKGQYGSHAANVRSFNQAALELGVEVREVCLPDATREIVDEPDSERYGYQTMKRVLAMPNRPDGLFVIHDWVARGALMAVLESHVVVPDQLKLVLHRNVEVGLLCPVRASFLDHSIADIAKAMIDSIDRQLRGEEVGPIWYRPTLTAGEVFADR